MDSKNKISGVKRDPQTDDRAPTSRDLRFHAGFEGLIHTVSKCLVNRSSGDIDEGINVALAGIGALAEVDRAYVFQFSSGQSHLSCTHEWCAEGVESARERIQGVPSEQFPWVVRKHLAGEGVCLPSVGDLPDEAASAREEFEAQGIQSVLSASIKGTRGILGFIGLDSVRTERAWSDSIRSLLSIVGQLLAHALDSLRIEEKLGESEEKYRRILETAQEGVWLVDQEGGTTYVNQRLTEMLGYTAEELTGRTALDFVDEPMRRFAAIRFAKHRRGARQQFDVLLRKKDGTGLWASLSASPVLDAGGQFVGSLGMVSDITTRKRAEDALLESNRRFEELAENIREVFWLFDWVTQELIYVSPAYEAIYGRPADSVMASYQDWMDCVHPDDLEGAMAAFSRSIDADDGAARQYRIVRPDGAIRWIEDRAFPVKDKDGALVHIAGIAEDITEKRLADEERLKVQKLESLSLLAGGIAHDFNNYLTAILGNLSLAMRNVGDKPKLKSNLERMESATLRAKDLTTQLLTFARGGEPVKRSISLTGLVREAASLSLRGSNVRCEVLSQPDLWPVDADRGQIGQALHNLVLNADQAMPDGGRLVIQLSNKQLGARNEVSLPPADYVVLSVTDEGQGISADHSARIFDPYFTTKDQGSGLGLTVVHSIVEKHGGRITVESTPGRGAEFRLYLPAAQVEDAQAPPRAGAEIRLQGRVLVMDDEEFVRLVAAEMLSHLGMDADTAVDGEEAIEKYVKALGTAEPFSAVLMDLTVPGGMGGKDAVQKLLDIDPDVRAIVSSGYSNDQVMASYREFGFRGVVVKPYQIKDLGDALREALSS